MSTAQEVHQLHNRGLCWSAYDPTVKCDLWSAAYEDDEGWLLIDPIPLNQEVWDSAFGEDKVVGILLTNSNHLRAAPFYQQRYHCPIWAAVEAQQELAPAVQQSFSHLEELFSLKAVIIPGAGVGETAFVSTDGVLMLGDALINLEPEGLALLPAKYCLNAKQNRDSLKSLLDYEFSIVTFAHGSPLRHQAKERLRGLLFNE